MNCSWPESACNVGNVGSNLGQEDALEKEMASHSSTVTWKIPWTEEPAKVQSMGLQRVKHDWETSLLMKQVACHLWLQGHLTVLFTSSGLKQAWPSTFTEHSPLPSLLHKQHRICTPGVSLHSTKCAGKCVILTLQIRVIWQSQYIPPVKDV